MALKMYIKPLGGDVKNLLLPPDETITIGSDETKISDIRCTKYVFLFVFVKYVFLFYLNKNL